MESNFSEEKRLVCQARILIYGFWCATSWSLDIKIMNFCDGVIPNRTHGIAEICSWRQSLSPLTGMLGMYWLSKHSYELIMANYTRISVVDTSSKLHCQWPVNRMAINLRVSAYYLERKNIEFWHLPWWWRQKGSLKRWILTRSIALDDFTAW
jgi:hypothetical protein